MQHRPPITDLRRPSPVAQGRKENLDKTRKLAGAKVQQREACLLPAGSSKLEIYEDEEFAPDEEEQQLLLLQQQQQQQQQQQAGRQQGAAAPAGKSQAETKAGALISALLGGKPSGAMAAATVAKPGAGLFGAGRAAAGSTGGFNLGGPAAKSNMPPPSSRLGAPSAAAHPTAPAPAGSAAAASRKAKPGDVYPSEGHQGYSTAGLIDEDGEEMTFEELRAAAYRRNHAGQQVQQYKQHMPQAQQQQQQEQQARKPISIISSMPDAAKPQAAAPAEQHAPAASSGRRALGLLADDDEAGPAPAEQQPQPAGSSRQGRRALGVLSERPSAPDDVASAAAAPAPAASSKRKALGPISAPAAAEEPPGPSRPQCPAQPILTEPTVTINTRAAYDAMNDMFSSNLVPAASKRHETDHHGSSRHGTAADPTVTINTRAAFDSINSMMQGGDLTTQSNHPAAAADANVTMHTRAAYDAIDNMFSSDMTLGNFKQAQQRQAEPTVTINTRAAFDAINGMFSSDMPAGAAAGHMAEPTVTLHTKAAFDDINHMFNSTLPLNQGRQVGEDTTMVTRALPGRQVRGHWLCRMLRSLLSSAAAMLATKHCPACCAGMLLCAASCCILTAIQSLTRALTTMCIWNSDLTLAEADHDSHPVQHANVIKLANAASGYPGGRPPRSPAPLGMYEDTEFIMGGCS